MRTFSILGILSILLLSVPAWTQTALSSPVIRDQRALSLLTSSVAAMTTPNSSQVVDITVEGTCTHWNGGDENAQFTYSAIHSIASYFEVHLPDGALTWTINAGRGIYIDQKGEKHLMHSKSAAQGNWYMPLMALFDSLTEASTSVTLAAESQGSVGGDDVIAIAPAPLSGSPATNDYTAAATRRVHLDRTTHLVREIEDQAFLSNDVGSSIPHNLRFSDYREDGGWVLPHSIDEYFGGTRIHSFTISQIRINAHLSAASFVVSQ